MRRLFSYLSVALLCCLSASSCIFEKVDNNTDKDLPTVNLKLSMPMTRATGTDFGTTYENTIIGTKDVKIFLFDEDTQRYIGQATNLRVKFGGNSSVSRVMEGDLPIETLGKQIKLVFMANYIMRGAEPIEPPVGEHYLIWREELIFSYGSKCWTEADAADYKFIPMAGETIFSVNPDKNTLNVATVGLERAVAKVRVKVNENCKFNITSLQVYNACPEGFSLIHPKLDPAENGSPQIEVPETFQPGLYDVLNFTGLNTRKVEFYIPESSCVVDPDKRTSMKITLDGDTVKTEIEFMDYKYTGKPEFKYFDIVRNTIYEFIVNKKADENKVDVQVSVMPWTTVNVDTEYE